MAVSYHQFLARFKVTGSHEVTHTSMRGTSYFIDDENLAIFYPLYHKHVLGPHPTPEFLTEKQRETGPLVIDVDFRLKEPQRAYTTTHVELFISLVMSELQRLFEDLPGDIEVYVMEKTRINVLPEKNLIKDGIHFFFGISMDITIKQMLRTRMLSRMDEIWDDLKPGITNGWADVVDKIMHAQSLWMLYGSRKPDHEAYLVTAHYTCSIVDGAPEIVKGAKPVVTTSFLPKLSVRYNDYNTLDSSNLSDRYTEEYDSIRSGSRPGRPQGRPNANVIDRSLVGINDDLTSPEKVDQALARLFESLPVSKHYVRDAHNFAMTLPESYWGDSSRDKWMRVGWALKHTDPDLFVSFVKFSTQWSKFDFDQVPELFKIWNSPDKKHDKTLTSRSLAYWSKKENRAAYDTVVKTSIDSLVNEIINGQVHTEYDLALLLYTAFKDNFTCTSIKNKTWYAFENHRWVDTDTGSELRKKLSESIYQLFLNKLMEAMAYVPEEKQAQEAQKRKVQKISNIMIDLKNHTKKANIMKEAADHFYEKGFYEKLDSKPYIIGCSNGVIDFDDSDLFRNGKPEDFVSKSTRLDYIPLTEENTEIVAEINEFFKQLFPHSQLRGYMWEHLASLLIGKNVNQTINFYTGIGRNGKSVLVDLISQIMGDYKATVPVSVLTQKRVGVGASSSEIAQLVGVRYAVMQEPSRGDKINEGVMKELTGGDELQARALFKDSITFPVLFKLVMCTNDLPDIKSNDEGTWRRIRVCPFSSVFKETPAEAEEGKLQTEFLVDKNIHEKFEKWRPVLFSMLVQLARVKRGLVVDVDIVTKASNEYRDQQDVFSDFLKSNVEHDPANDHLKESDIRDRFSSWFKESHPTDKAPNYKELWVYMIRTGWGKRVPMTGPTTFWMKIKLVKPAEPADNP